MSEQGNEQATGQGEVAAPGPHPHESADVTQWRGDTTEVPTDDGGDTTGAEPEQTDQAE